MHPSSAIHATLLLIALSLDLTFVASVENVTILRRHATKTFTNLLKVPWINLDIPWIHEEQSACRNDIATLSKSAAAAELWALQMLDASSKIPAGLLTGNIRDLGMYEECIQIEPRKNSANIQGRHCMVSFAVPTKLVEDPAAILYVQKVSAYNPTPDIRLSFAASLCLPSTCGIEDITGFIDASVQSEPEFTGFEISIAQVTCSKIASEVQVFTIGTILTVSFFIAVFAFLMLCTVCDFVVKSKNDITSPTLTTLAKFSLYTNAIKLSSTEVPPGTMPAIHGIRFLSMFLIVTVHRILSTMVKPLVNLSDIYVMRHSWLAPFVLILPYAVDTFFILSGFLTAYLFLNRLRSVGKINLVEMYIHRYLRLAPCVAVLILFDIFILPHFGSGPLWEIVLGVTSEFCRKNWWINLLYIQNFVNSEQMCLPHTWYSAAEMQLFWLCPIILFPLFYRPKLGLAMLTTLLVVTLITPAIHLVLNQYSFLFNTRINFSEQYNEFIASYTLTYNRALPYFVGILLGYCVVNNKKKLTKVQTTFNWTLAGIVILFCLWNTAFVQPNSVTYNPGWEAAYVSVGRLGWSFAVAWLLYACTQGYGGPLGTFLSLPVFVPLSRISYGIYLVSAVLQVGINATEHTAEYHSIVGMVYLVWGDLALSTAISFVLNLCFETPIVVIEKLLKARGSSRVVNGVSIEKKEKLLAIIREYPDLNNGYGSSNPEIETKMSQLHFWRSVSDVLNTLGRRSTKAPEEWLQTWQDWRVDLLKNDGKRKTEVKTIENVSAQLENGKTTLEKELLLFVAAVSSGLDDIAKLNGSEITESAKSQKNSYQLKNGSHVTLPTYTSNALIEKTSKFSGSTGNELPSRNIADSH